MNQDNVRKIRREFAKLLVHRLCNLGTAMPSPASPQSGDSIIDLSSIGRSVVASFGANHEARVAFKLAVASIGHPVGIQLFIA